MHTPNPLTPLVRRYVESDAGGVARVLESMPDAVAIAALKELPPAVTAKALRHLQAGYAATLLAEASPELFQAIVRDLEPDRAARIYARLPADARERFVPYLPEKMRGEVRELLTYPEGSVGQVMSTDVIALRQEITVREAVATLRRKAKGRVQHSYAYVVGDGEVLAGVLSTYDLLLADTRSTLETAMRIDVFTVGALLGQEEAAAELAKRRYFAAPVVDAEGRLLGVVKAEQLLTGAKSEVAEDLQKMFGAGAEERVTSSIGFSLRKRLPWLHVNLLTAFMVFGVGDLAYDSDEYVRARARSAPGSSYKTHERFLRDVQGPKTVRTRITVDELDVLVLRNVPSDDFIKRPWATAVATEFARVALRRGVIVVSDPSGLAKASSKMYLQLFPEEVRPRTLISRDNAEIKAFAREEGTVVLKPLQGSGGASVFLVRPEDMANINQMIDAVSRDGFVIAQEYLPAAAEGDTRLFMINGRPLLAKGKYAAFRRLRRGDDIRSNIHAGGKLAPAEIDAPALRLAEIVRPKLVQNGMFLVGLDIVGDKLMEINVFSPGGLGSAQKFTKVNFCREVIVALQRKVDYMEFYGRNFDNVEMSTL